MRVINCPRCGKIFNVVLRPICKKCERLEEKQFIAVRDYIEEYPTDTLVEVADATDVPAKTILRFIREGRLLVSDGLSDEIRCSHCGKPMQTGGNFCPECSDMIQRQLTSGVAVRSSGQSMHIHKR